MITFERVVTYEDEPTDDEYLDVRAGHAAMMTYNRSPKVSGQYRVEHVVAVVDGRRFKFLLRCCCRTQADHVESDLGARDLSLLTTAQDLGRMGFEEVR